MVVSSWVEVDMLHGSIVQAVEETIKNRRADGIDRRALYDVEAASTSTSDHRSEQNSINEDVESREASTQVGSSTLVGSEGQSPEGNHYDYCYDDDGDSRTLEMVLGRPMLHTMSSEYFTSYDESQPNSPASPVSSSPDPILPTRSSDLPPRILRQPSRLSLEKSQDLDDEIKSVTGLKEISHISRLGKPQQAIEASEKSIFDKSDHFSPRDQTIDRNSRGSIVSTDEEDFDEEDFDNDDDDDDDTGLSRNPPIVVVDETGRATLFMNESTLTEDDSMDERGWLYSDGAAPRKRLAEGAGVLHIEVSSDSEVTAEVEALEGPCSDWMNFLFGKTIECIQGTIAGRVKIDEESNEGDDMQSVDLLLDDLLGYQECRSVDALSEDRTEVPPYVDNAEAPSPIDDAKLPQGANEQKNGEQDKNIASKADDLPPMGELQGAEASLEGVEEQKDEELSAADDESNSIVLPADQLSGVGEQDQELLLPQSDPTPQMDDLLEAEEYKSSEVWASVVEEETSDCEDLQENEEETIVQDEDKREVSAGEGKRTTDEARKEAENEPRAMPIQEEENKHLKYEASMIQTTPREEEIWQEEEEDDVQEDFQVMMADLHDEFQEETEEYAEKVAQEEVQRKTKVTHEEEAHEFERIETEPSESALMGGDVLPKEIHQDSLRKSYSQEELYPSDEMECEKEEESSFVVNKRQSKRVWRMVLTPTERTIKPWREVKQRSRTDKTLALSVIETAAKYNRKIKHVLRIEPKTMDEIEDENTDQRGEDEDNSSMVVKCALSSCLGSGQQEGTNSIEDVSCVSVLEETSINLGSTNSFSEDTQQELISKSVAYNPYPRDFVDYIWAPFDKTCGDIVEPISRDNNNDDNGGGGTLLHEARFASDHSASTLQGMLSDSLPMISEVSEDPTSPNSRARLKKDLNSSRSGGTSVNNLAGETILFTKDPASPRSRAGLRMHLNSPRSEGIGSNVLSLKSGDSFVNMTDDTIVFTRDPTSPNSRSSLRMHLNSPRSEGVGDDLLALKSGYSMVNITEETIVFTEDPTSPGSRASVRMHLSSARSEGTSGILVSLKSSEGIANKAGSENGAIHLSEKTDDSREAVQANGQVGDTISNQNGIEEEESGQENTNRVGSFTLKINEREIEVEMIMENNSETKYENESTDEGTEEGEEEQDEKEAEENRTTVHKDGEGIEEEKEEIRAIRREANGDEEEVELADFRFLIRPGVLSRDATTDAAEEVEVEMEMEESPSILMVMSDGPIDTLIDEGDTFGKVDRMKNRIAGLANTPLDPRLCNPFIHEVSNDEFGRLVQSNEPYSLKKFDIRNGPKMEQLPFGTKGRTLAAEKVITTLDDQIQPPDESVYRRSFFTFPRFELLHPLSTHLSLIPTTDLDIFEKLEAFETQRRHDEFFRAIRDIGMLLCDFMLLSNTGERRDEKEDYDERIPVPTQEDCINKLDSDFFTRMFISRDEGRGKFIRFGAYPDVDLQQAAREGSRVLAAHDPTSCESFALLLQQYFPSLSAVSKATIDAVLPEEKEAVIPSDRITIAKG